MRLFALFYALLHLLVTGCTPAQRRALIPVTVATPISMTQGIGGRYEGTAISIGITPVWSLRSHDER